MIKRIVFSMNGYDALAQVIFSPCTQSDPLEDMYGSDFCVGHYCTLYMEIPYLSFKMP